MMRAQLFLFFLWTFTASSPIQAQTPNEATTSSAYQWPHWRGPLATGAAPHADPPTVWNEKTNVKWKAAIPGRGSSTPVVWGDRIFVATAVDTGREAKQEDLPKIDPKRERKTEPPKTYHQFLLIC